MTLKTRTEHYAKTRLLIEGIFKMEESGWSVRQIFLTSNDHEYLVVFEREFDW